MSISDKALLANVSISQWVGRKLDKNATASVENKYYTDSKVGNYTKKLLPGAVELDAITKHAQSLRGFFHKQSLPWCTDGSRILPSKNYMEFTAEFTRRKAQFDGAVAAFVAAYPKLVIDAQKKLGDLFSDAEYPGIESLQDKFKCEVSFMPIPDVNDFRVSISDAEKATFIESMKQVETAAMQDCWNRLHDSVMKAAVKLASPDAIFRDSLIENITECCTLLTKLNVTDDPNLESMRREVERLAATISPESMRAVPANREDAASKLAELTSKMSQFMGQ